MSSIANPQLDGMPKMAFALVSIALVSFSLYTAMFGVFPDMIQRGAHLSAVIALVYIRFFGFSARGAGPLGLGWSHAKFLVLARLALALPAISSFSMMMLPRGTVPSPAMKCRSPSWPSYCFLMPPEGPSDGRWLGLPYSFWSTRILAGSSPAF